MSEINVDRIADSTGLGAPEFPYGVILNSSVGVITAANVSVANSVTATEYYGDGSKLTGVATGDANYAEVAGIATLAQGLTGSPTITVTAVNASGEIDANVVDVGTKVDVGSVTSPAGGVQLNTGDISLRTDSRSAGYDGVMLYRGGNAISDRVGGFRADGYLIASSGEITGDLNIDGNVSIAGTVTHQDVTDIDSVGLITAREGIKIPDDKNIDFGAGPDLSIYHQTSPELDIIESNTVLIRGKQGLQNPMGYFRQGSGQVFYYAGDQRLETTNGGINVTGSVTATSFSGDGSGLTGVGGASWTLGANGTSDYTFTGPGLTGAENDPTLYLVRGQTYKFVNSMGAHPFRIQSDPNGSAGTEYNDGITNNNVSNGTLEWDVQFDAPDVLYYQCTAHPSMGGIIYIGTESRGLQNITNSGRTLIKGDVGTLINTSSGGTVTVPSGVFEPGDLVTVYNNYSSTMSISASGTTLRKAGTSNTGTCTVAEYGTASILCVSSNEFVVSGNIS